jgi:predicted ATPase
LNDVLEHSAVQLFIARTRALHSGFSPRVPELPTIASICRRLDDIPLAIEFAAARAATLGLEQVLARLDSRFELLTGSRRTALPRHQTLRATLAWSYQLLPEAERRLLCFVAVFSAGFTLEAAAFVINDAETDSSAAVEEVANLVAKSLIVLDGSGPPSRWRLLETTRAYALEKLAESGEAGHAARRHAEFFRNLFAPIESATGLTPAPERMAIYLQEINNVRAALDWALSEGGDTAIGVVLTAAYVPVWIHLSLMVECRERIERAMNSLEPESNLTPRLRMQLYIALAVALVYTTGLVDRTATVLAQALDIAESLDDVDFQLRALWAIWTHHSIFGEYRAAQSAAERFSEVVRQRGDPADILVSDRLMGNVMHYTGDQREARRYFERMLDGYVAPSDQRHTMWFHVDQRVVGSAILARVLWLQGFVEQASHLAQASFNEAQATDQKLTLCYALGEAVCPVALMTGDLATAELSIAMLISIATRHGLTFWATLGRCLKGKLAIMAGDFARGSVWLRAELAMFTGRAMHYSGFHGDLAEGVAATGHLTEGMVIIDQALARFDRDGVRWCVADALRVKGELLLRAADDQSISAAEGCFLGALEVARQQGALFWELRAARSLAHLRVRQGRLDEARSILGPVYGKFTEGFEIPDLRAVGVLLRTLPSHVTASPVDLDNSDRQTC